MDCSLDCFSGSAWEGGVSINSTLSSSCALSSSVDSSAESLLRSAFTRSAAIVSLLRFLLK